LLTAIDEAIEVGTVDTWTVDDDGDYRLSDDEGSGIGWMRATIKSDTEVVLNIIAPENEDMSIAGYAALHVKFVDMLLTYFDSHFDEATITASGDDDDAL
jgi:hypothetical protein